MNQDNKISCWRKMYALLDENAMVRDLQKPDDMKDLEISCNLGEASLHYQLQIKQDILMIRSELPCGERSPEEIMEFSTKLTAGRKEDINVYCIGDKIAITLRLVFSQMTEEQAMTEVDAAGEAFVAFYMEHTDKIRDFINGTLEEEHEASIEPEEAVYDYEELFPEDEMFLEDEALMMEEIDEAEDSTEDEGPPYDEAEAEEEDKFAYLLKVAEMEEERTESVADPVEERLTFALEKEAYLQYQEDQKLLMDEREKELKAMEESLKKREQDFKGKKDVSQKEYKDWKKEQAALEERNRELSCYADSMKKEYAKKEAALKEAREAFEKAKEEWNKTTPDERIIKRRKELSLLEDAFCKKEQEFQEFRKSAIDEISKGLDDLAGKEEAIQETEKELAKKAKKQEERWKKLQEKEKKIREKEAVLVHKAAELSDQEAELKRASIIREDALNLEKQIGITKKTVEREKKKLEEEKKAFEKEREGFDSLKEEVTSERENLLQKEKELAAKETELFEMISKTEALKKERETFEAVKEENQNEKEVLVEKLHKKDHQIEELQKEKEGLQEDISEKEKQMESLLMARKDLQKNNQKLKKEKKEMDFELARIRSELFEKTEALVSSTGMGAEDMARMKELSSQCEAYRDGMESMRSEISNLKELLRAEHEKCMAAESQAGENNRDEEERRQLLYELENSDIEFSEVIGEKQFVYTAEQDGCRIYFDLDSEMLQVERPLKKGYSKVNRSEAERLNYYDIRESYLLEGKKVICRRKVTKDFHGALNDVLRNLQNFKG